MRTTAESILKNSNGKPAQRREILTLAGPKLFGNWSFAAFLTQQIARLAEADIFALSYHIGGENGPRMRWQSIDNDEFQLTKGAAQQNFHSVISKQNRRQI